jgi:hypothetical protein
LNINFIRYGVKIERKLANILIEILKKELLDLRISNGHDCSELLDIEITSGKYSDSYYDANKQADYSKKMLDEMLTLYNYIYKPMECIPRDKQWEYLYLELQKQYYEQLVKLINRFIKEYFDSYQVFFCKHLCDRLYDAEIKREDINEFISNMVYMNTTKMSLFDSLSPMYIKEILDILYDLKYKLSNATICKNDENSKYHIAASQCI